MVIYLPGAAMAASGGHGASMRIRVYPPPFADFSRLDERGYAEMAEGATLGELLKALRVPLARLAVTLCTVNHARAAYDRVLEDGDVVSFFSLLPGG